LRGRVVRLAQIPESTSICVYDLHVIMTRKGMAELGRELEAYLSSQLGGLGRIERLRALEWYLSEPRELLNLCLHAAH